jgi:hypothetical protein
MIAGLTGVDYQDSSIADSILSLGCLAAIYIGGYFSVRDIRISALDILRDSAIERAPSGNFMATPGIILLGNKRPLLFFKIVKTQKRIIGIVLITILAISISVYAVYTITVENMIMQNPVVAAVVATGTKVKIKHFNCEDSYGFYDVNSDTMQICTAAHDDQLESSKESTIRHEAWHVVQACASVASKDDEWGNLVTLNPPNLINASLSDDDEEFIRDTYPAEEWKTEREARLAELFMTDKNVIEYLQKHCYWD